VGGTYYVRAYRDTNANGVYDYPESYGWYGGSVAASANAITTTTNANITMVVPAAPPATPATFTMSGNISGGTSGTYHISAFTSTTVLNGTTYINGTTLASPGSYNFTLPAGGTYYINAYRDTNGNNSYDTGEPSGWYGGSVPASANAVTTTTNGNIMIVSAPVAYVSPSFTISGTVSGGDNGTYYLSAFTATNYTGYSGGVSSNSGTFSFTVPVGGTYYVTCYRDENGDGSYTNGESSAWYGVPNPISSTANITFAIPGPHFHLIVTATGGTAGNYYVDAFTNNNYTGWAAGASNASGTGLDLKLEISGTYYVSGYRDTNGNGMYDAGEPTSTQTVVTSSSPAGNTLSIVVN
jgi:uncharacterized protein (DUF2141 family)